MIITTDINIIGHVKLTTPFNVVEIGLNIFIPLPLLLFPEALLI